MSSESTPGRRGDLEPLAQVEEGYVLLPFSEDQFRDFIKTLLGSPQAFSRRFFGRFEIDASTLRNIHFMLLQRLNQQNDSTLIYFRARIDYSDNSSVEHDSIESLLSYNEIRPVISVQAHLTWDFLVRFTDRPVPEKQRIQLSVDTGNAFLSMPSPKDGDTEEIRQGRIEFRIEHTARTWAADIEALLSGHLQTIVHTSSAWMLALRKYGLVTIGVITLIFSVVTTIVTTRGEEALAQKMIDGLVQNIRSSEDTGTKIEYLAAVIAREGMPTTEVASVVAIVLTFLIGGISGGIFLAALRRGVPGFLILTKESLRHQADVQRRMKRRWLAVIGSIVFAIVIELFANIVFARYFENQL